MTLDLAATDHVALVRRYLIANERVAQVLGDGGLGPNEPPYPKVRVSDPPGDDRGAVHLLSPLVQIEVWGDIEGGTVAVDKATLRKVLYTVQQELALLPERQATGVFPILTDEPVVTSVSGGSGGYVPEPTGQPRYLSTMRLHVHPNFEAVIEA